MKTDVPQSTFTPDTEGVFYDVPAETYHRSPGVSHSMLKNIEPPARLPAYLTQKRESSAAQVLGSIVHSVILEPAKPLPMLVVPPPTYPAPADCSSVKQKKAQPGDPLDWSWSAKYCKQWKADMIAQGLLVITQAEFDTTNGIIQAVAAHPRCSEIFREGRSEVSVYVKCPTTGVLRRARLDFVPPGNALVDVKTCLDASPEAFSRAVFDHGYHTQADYYLRAWNDAAGFEEKECFIFIAVEKTPPLLVACYTLEAEAIELGRATNLRRLQSYADCSESKHWPGFSQEFVTIQLPRWAYKTT